MRAPVILRPPEYADIDEVPIAAQGAMPLDACVGRENHVSVMGVTQMLEEVRRCRRFPEELVHPPWAAMTQKQAIPAHAQTALGRQLLHPGAVGGVGVRKGV